MLALLPLISLLFLCIIFYRRGNCWRSAILSSALVWGILLTVITEILSLGRLLTLEWLTSAWATFDIAIVFIYFKRSKRNRQYDRQNLDLKLSSLSLLLLGGIAFIVLTIGLNASLAAPNNWDSMSYHLARIVHWIQNRSIAYYPTSYLPQLYQKPWSEFAIMHFQILSGGDQFANLIQWSSMVGSIIGVSLIAKQLGADLQGQILAAVFCTTIPMGILQGSSTQNDYVVSFWLVCFVYYLLLVASGTQSNANSFNIGASLGLAFCTKAVAYIYTLPFLVWLLLLFIKRLKQDFWKPILRITTLVFLLNAGHEIRNIDLFGRPLASGAEKYTNEIFGIPVILSNIVRNLSLHIYIPIKSWSDFIEGSIYAMHRSLNIGTSDPRTSWPVEFHLTSIGHIFGEDSAANTIHLLLILGSGVIFAKEKKLKANKNLLLYLISLISAFLLFCSILKWQPWHSRLHLPLFVLFSAFVGTIFSSSILPHKKTIYALALALIVASLPWVFCNASHPLIATINKKILTPSSYENIFNTSRINQYFVKRSELLSPYIGATSFINSRSCSKVGLSLGVDDWEYPLWLLLQKNNEKQYEIEQIDVTNISAIKYQVYPHSNFIPCAIISVEHPNSKSTSKEIKKLANTYSQEWSQDSVKVFTNGN